MEEKTKNTGWAGPDFMSQRLNTAKLERRRIKNIEEKDNQAYAAKADIDPIGLELFNMISHVITHIYNTYKSSTVSNHRELENSCQMV